MPSTLFYLSTVFAALTSLVVKAAFPPKIYGVNLGSWLLVEPWMLPQEWIDMGGQQCDDCSQCIASEFEFAKAFPDTVDAKFNVHWNTWFNQSDVDELARLGINTVRVPLGYWIVEDLVDRSTEFYPRGGLKQLRRGLQQLKNAGITAILDHHALPGVQDAQQMFTGRCTTDVEFYTPHNYHRALVWTAVMTALTHLDPNFDSVTAIEAVNEPIMDATQTPGYGDFQKHFVEVVRAVELALGVSVPSYEDNYNKLPFSTNITVSFNTVCGQSIFDSEVASVLMDSIPIILKIATEFDLLPILGFSRKPGSHAEPLFTNFMDINWQHNNPSNPADAAIGPQIYDNHLYYSFEAYLTSICNLDRIQSDAALGNTPLYFGEWALPTQFQATDEFLFKWADAQKLAYSKGAGWLFWNFKIEKSQLAGDMARQWSYTEGVRLGFLTQDPSKVHDPNVCAPYINSSTATTTASYGSSR
ncbi:glycoside hydrolase family 5 protein [Macrolepiota fuliginosa MF-IS2]|uniref:Glycoside hydrolase family 5 protein n=1 Tax=Macrolepiota fuliginosa MF-IS2 TaxID=1400762 RepID=A0A9P6C9X8_9AGAR|nr:glycoside hydrolase family 5 protein [Macrolepiota fuliginosa MF-IS2]